MRLNLGGNRFDVFFDGNQEMMTRSGTSDHYYDYSDDYYWVQGSGKIVEKASGKETVFLFSTPQVRDGKDVRFEDRIFSHNSPSLGHKPLSEIILPGREPYLVDFIAERMLVEIDGDKRNLIPHCHLVSLDYNTLVAQGVIPDSGGQVSLPGLVTI